MHRRHFTAQRAATTLTELVVVIAIICVLAGMSFYAFTAAKGFADKMEDDTRLASHKATQNAKTNGARNAPVITGGERPTYVPGEYYVGFNPTVANPSAQAQRLASLIGGRVVGVYTHGILGCGLRCPDANIGQLTGDPAVGLIHQAKYVYLCANAPINIRRVNSNGILGTRATTPANTMYGAPPNVFRMYRNTNIQGIINSRVFLGGTSTASVAVALLDSGIDATHPDLNVVYAQDFTGGNDPSDTDGHGTHLAGVIGAVDKSNVPAPNTGVVGVYPGAPLLNLKIAPIPGAILPAGSSLAVYGALDFVIANASAIPVCCLPFVTAAPDPTMDSLVNQAADQGVLMIAASGGTIVIGPQNMDTPGKAFSPANAAGAICVGDLTDLDGIPGQFGGAGDDIYNNVNCNFGSAVVFVAPGGHPNNAALYVNSTIPIAGQIKNGLAAPYAFSIFGNGVVPAPAHGSSFSAAHVAGMMALLKDPNTNLGFVLGVGRGVTTYHLQMNTRAQAVAALLNVTHQTTPFQMINPRTGSAWAVSGFPRRVHPYMQALYGDFVTDPVGRRIPVANFYANPNVGPSFLAPFPG